DYLIDVMLSTGKLSSRERFCDTAWRAGLASLIYMGMDDGPVTPILPGVPGPWGKGVRRLLAEHGKTKTWLALKAGSHPNTMTAICKGQHTLTSQLQAIADVFSVPIEAVLGIGIYLESGSPFATFVSPEDATVASNAKGAQVSHTSS